MGFTALGGLAAVLVSMPPVSEAWRAAGGNIALSALSLAATVAVIIIARKKVMPILKLPVTLLLLILGSALISTFFRAGQAGDRSDQSGPYRLPGRLESPDRSFLARRRASSPQAPAGSSGASRLVCGADYLAIATLGISEIIIAIIKYEEWLTRGVKNVTGLPRPVPYEVNLVEREWFINLANWFGATDLSDAASIFVKLCYATLFIMVLAIVMWFAERALKSPLGAA